MILLHHIHKVYASAEAAAVDANSNNAGDEDGWVYEVVIDPTGTGKAVIKITDEDGYEVGLL